MRSSLSLISGAKISELIQLEPILLLLGLSGGAYLFYKLFLKEVSVERHENLKRLFRNLLFHLTATLTLLLVFLALERLEVLESLPGVLARLNAYIGFLAIVWGLYSFVKLSRILVFEWLFIGHMRVGVPLLLVNLCSLLLSLVLGGWLLTEVFNFKIASLLATSAVVSLIIGLAIQDTLGNLFAGIALQFDKPFELGDWVEIQLKEGPDKWSGKVEEISWRATTLVSMTDEFIVIPNRIIAQAKVSNYSSRRVPFCRRLEIKLEHSTSIHRVKQVLFEAVKDAPGVEPRPVPLILVDNVYESWTNFKVIYFTSDYGNQYIHQDQIVSRMIAALGREGIAVAKPKLEIRRLDEFPKV